MRAFLPLVDHKLEDFSEIWKASFLKKVAFSKVAEEFI